MDLFPPPVLATQRLVLRQLFEGDWAEILHLRSDPGVNALVQRKLSKDKNDALEFIANAEKSMEANELINWGLVLPGVNTVMGTICIWQIDWDKKVGEVGYDLDTRYHNKGYMTEALNAVVEFGFKELGLEKLEAYTQHNNPASVRLLEKFHFALVPEKRDSGNPDNRVFEVNRTTWLENQPQNDSED